jgi:hypothetical protein
MADDVLRGLERRYRDMGAVDDHARWITARVRAGELSEHRARFASDLGHAAARLAMGGPSGKALEEVIATIHGVCGAIREPVGHANAHWILTGEQPPPAAIEDGLIVEDQLNARIALAAARAALIVVPVEGECRTGLDRLETWIRCPCDEHDAPAWGPALSRAEVLTVVAPASREHVSESLAAMEAEWAQDQGDWPGFHPWEEYGSLVLPWVDSLDAIFDVTQDEPGDGMNDRNVLRALLGSPAGLVIFSCCAAIHAGMRGKAMRLAVQGAVRAAGEAVVRVAIVREVGPWLLREES